MIRVRRRVREARVENDELRARLLAIDDALSVRVEVMTGLEMAADENDDLRVGEVRARPVHAHPPVVARTRTTRAHVGMRVVAIYGPRGQHALGVSVLTGAPDVVHDLLVTLLLHRPTDARGDVVQGIVPRHPLPLPFPAGTRPFERIQDAIRVGDLVDGRGSLGAVAPPGTGVLGVSLELADLQRVPIDVREQPTSGLAVEARRRHQHVSLLDPLRPRLRVKLDPIVPTLLGWVRCEMHAACTGVERLAAGLHLGFRGRDASVQVMEVGHAKGTDWPACTKACS